MNSLLALPHPLLPTFSQLDFGEIPSQLTQLLEKNRKLVTKLAQSTNPQWDSVMLPLIAANDEIDRFWSPISHLNSVCDSPALREIYQSCQNKLISYEVELLQNSLLFQCVERLSKQTDSNQYTQSQKQALSHLLRDFRLAGVTLCTDKKKILAALQKQLSSLQTQFEQNILDATSSGCLHLTRRQDLMGLPNSVIEQAHCRAVEKNLKGWLVTLQAPSYIPFMQHAKNRALREKLYTAYITRASEQGPDKGRYDNSHIMKKILHCRHQLATLLGFPSYAQFALQTRMAIDVKEINNLLYDLLDCSRETAEQEWKFLQDFAEQSQHPLPLQPWDIAYISEQYKQQKFNFTDEQLRPYFPLPRVFSGMFKLVEQLYDIHISVVNKKSHIGIDRWHKEVSFFQISDKNNQTIGFFYTDLYARDHKRGGAWMAECISRFCYQQHCQLPVAFLTCNFQPPTFPQPALLTHDEVVTLFHEFGHTLHHLLTTVDLPPVAGINGVPWDAVELPSQFMENYCWQEQIIQQISQHIETGEALPRVLFEQLKQSRTFQTGMQMLRQLELSLFDIILYSTEQEHPNIQKILNTLRQQTSVIPIVPYNRFQHSFSHIFAGGYAAGYYSYKWAEVLAADAFSRFEEEGLLNTDTGKDFLEKILCLGGTEDPTKMFINFRGRKPTIAALLRHSGLPIANNR